MPLFASSLLFSAVRSNDGAVPQWVANQSWLMFGFPQS
jgi:hypothetical protein